MVSTLWLTQAVGIGWNYDAGMGDVLPTHRVEVPQLGAGCSTCCRLPVHPLMMEPYFPSVFLPCV